VQSSKPSKRTGSVDLHVGLKIRDRRRELRLSQTDLGREVGVSFQQLQKYENGKNRVGASRLAAIAKALKVPVAYFFPVDETGEPTEVDIAAQIVDLQARLSFVQAGLERLRKLLLAA
jgi:transcriptional regulator with XRE-family HTH domain